MIRDGRQYETCMICGLEYNVSILRKPGNYICPLCCYRRKKQWKETL